MRTFGMLRVVSLFFISFTWEGTLATHNVKTWKPNNNIFNRDNWVEPNLEGDCGKIEFGKINFADIFIDKLTAEQFILPISGDLILLDGGYLELVNSKSNKKTNCLKLKELNLGHYLNPNNWDSKLSGNPAVPDIEKIPCRYDKVKFPNGIYSGVDMEDILRMQSVSGLEFINDTFDRADLEAFKTSDIGRSVFYGRDQNGARLTITERTCFDASGCTCNKENTIRCPPKKDLECLNPVAPIGFCHEICGAFVIFESASGFSLNQIEMVLKEYTDVETHVSKVTEGSIQVVFAEQKYTGDSVGYATKFYEKLQEKSKEYKIAKLGKLRVSGSQTSGNFSIWNVIFASLFFVIGLFAVIFYAYGYYEIPFGIRFSSPVSLPLSSTYRARFSPREDESGLIFDNQSLVGSVMDLDQSFDNPMYGQVSTAADINGDERNVVPEPITVKNETCQKENPQNDPLRDLKRLNEELKEEIGTDLVQELPKTSNNFPPSLYELEKSQPLIEVIEEEDEEFQ